MAALQKLKTGKNFVVYTDGQQKLIKIRGRISYPAFGEKKKSVDQNSGKTRENWGGVLMLPKATHKEAYEEMSKIIEEIKANSLNEKTGKKGVMIDPANLCLKDGDHKEDEQMHGHWLITFSDSNRQPGIRDSRGDLMLDIQAIDNKFYGGCWVEVMLRPWYFNGKAKNDANTYPKRISCGFTGAQFVKDDEPFGSGRIDDSDAWGSVESDGLDDDDEM